MEKIKIDVIFAWKGRLYIDEPFCSAMCSKEDMYMGAEPEAAFPVNHFCAFGSERCYVFPREVLERLRARVVPADVTDLCAAAAGGDAEKVRELLEAGGEVKSIAVQNK